MISPVHSKGGGGKWREGAITRRLLTKWNKSLLYNLHHCYICTKTMKEIVFGVGVGKVCIKDEDNREEEEMKIEINLAKVSNYTSYQ